MLIEQVDETRLIILLSAKDLEDLGLTFAELDWQEAKCRAMMEALLQKAFEKTGFSAEGKRMLIEAAPGADGCVIVVTLMPQKETRKRYKRKEQPEVLLYEFETAEALLAAAARFSAQKDVPQEGKLVEIEGRYYLALFALNPLTRAARALLAEYAKPVGRGAAATAHMLEYGRLIAQGAVFDQINTAEGA